MVTVTCDDKANFKIDYKLDLSEFKQIQWILDNSCAKKLSTTEYLSKKEDLIDICYSLKSQNISINLGESALNIIKNKAKDAQDILEEKSKFLDALEKKFNFKLFNFQREDILSMSLRKSVLNANEMGLGKTLEAICMIPEDGRAIILTNTVGKGTYLTHINRFRPDLKISFPKQFKCPIDKGEVLCYTYSTLPNTSTECKNKIPLEEYYKDIDSSLVLIADEYHVCKSYSADRTKRFRALAKHVLKKNGHVYAFTGSPLLKNPNDFWCLLQNLELANLIFGNWKNYQTLMGGKLANMYGRKIIHWNPKLISSRIVDMIKPYVVRRTRAEVLTDLPDKIREFRKIPYKKIYKNYLDKLLSMKELEEQSFMEIRQELSKEKFQILQEIISDISDQEAWPIIVVSTFRDPILRLGKQSGWACITGTTPGLEREKIATDFQNGKYKAIAMTIEAGGYALTLTRACNMIFLDRAWAQEVNKQCEDRIMRIGQKNNCNYLYLIMDHEVEDRITEILQQKELMVEKTIAKLTEGKRVNVVNQIEDILNAS